MTTYETPIQTAQRAVKQARNRAQQVREALNSLDGIERRRLKEIEDREARGGMLPGEREAIDLHYRTRQREKREYLVRTARAALAGVEEDRGRVD